MKRYRDRSQRTYGKIEVANKNISRYKKRMTWSKHIKGPREKSHTGSNKARKENNWSQRKEDQQNRASIRKRIHGVSRKRSNKAKVEYPNSTSGKRSYLGQKKISPAVSRKTLHRVNEKNSIHSQWTEDIYKKKQKMNGANRKTIPHGEKNF